MKKIVVLGMTFMLIMASTISAFGAGYTDVIKGNWAFEAVDAMSEKAIVKGYPDGSFKPNNTVTYGEFIKMALIADTGEDTGNAASGHWALNYYNKALELGYYTQYDIDKSQLGDKITRSDMALIISAILGDVKIADYEKIQEGIEDITYQTPHESDITKAYASGILTGYSDETFRPNKTLSRAEAATVIYRLVDESKRILPYGVEQEVNKKPIKEVITNIDSFYTENGYLDEFLTKAETYEFDLDSAKYEMTLHENRGTKWIHFPASVEKDLGRRYFIKENKVVERLSPTPLLDGSKNAGYKTDITTIDFIVSLNTENHHILLIANPFKK